MKNRKKCPVCGRYGGITEHYEDNPIVIPNDVFVGGEYGAFLAKVDGGIDACTDYPGRCASILSHKTGKVLRYQFLYLIPIKMLAGS